MDTGGVEGFSQFISVLCFFLGSLYLYLYLTSSFLLPNIINFDRTSPEALKIYINVNIYIYLTKIGPSASVLPVFMMIFLGLILPAR